MGIRQVIAHRGASASAPENTLASIRRAIAQRATVVEMDVRQCQDGHLVLLHDATLDRTTSGKGLVGEVTLTQLRRLDAGSWFAAEFAGERVPTLEEALSVCRDQVDVLLDLKQDDDRFGRAVAAAVKQAGQPERTWIGVRSTAQAAGMRKLLPAARQLGLLATPNEIEDFGAAGVEMIRLWPQWIDSDAGLARRVRSTGAALHLNGRTGHSDEVRPLLKHNPASLSSDDPARLWQTLAEMQAAQDAAHDKVQVIWTGTSPDRLACDTTLRQVPDGTWVMVMLGGGDREPLPENRIFLTRSIDQGRSWSAMKPVNLGVKDADARRALVPTELTVHNGRCTLFFATHDGRFGQWKTWMVHSDDSCRTWSTPLPAPGVLAERTFIRNAIVTRDGRLVLPFQHYVQAPGPHDPRNGVMISEDGGKNWSVHGWIRIAQDDQYRGWAEANVVELADGTLSMLIRADRLGGILYRADSPDGGKTWSDSYRTDIPNPGSKVTLYALGGDTVALLHNPHPRQRNPLSLWISFDGMQSWPYRRDLVTWPGRLNYPDGFVSADGSFLHFAFDDNRQRAVYVGAKLPR